MKLLVTGFEPFGGQKINASWLAVKELPDRIGDVDIVKVEIPVVILKSVDLVLKTAKEHAVDAIICVGEYGGTSKVNVELIGTNWLNMGIPDNEDNQVEMGLSYEDGPDAHFATIPAAKIAKSLSQKLPIALSLSAGAYVCNHVLYGVLEKGDKPAGFVHVPTTDGQHKGDSMDTETTSQCLRAIIEELGRLSKETTL